MDIQGIPAIGRSIPIAKGDAHISNKVAAATHFNDILNATKRKIDNRLANAKQSLQTAYPGLKYHVLDASQFTYWNRLDFPASKLFEETVDVQALKSWRPTAPTATGYEPHVQKDLEKIPNGSYAVFVHPATQEKMDKDPEYAKSVTDKMKDHFINTIKINEAISPGCTKGIVQAVTITKDGGIGFRLSILDGPAATKGKAKTTTAIKVF